LVQFSGREYQAPFQTGGGAGAPTMQSAGKPCGRFAIANNEVDYFVHCQRRSKYAMKHAAFPPAATV